MANPSPLLPARQRAQELAGSGDTEAAVALLEHVIDMGRVNLGEDHPDLLAACHQLARLHQSSGDPAAARRVLEEAYAAGQWRLGDADPLMLEISYDLGVVAEELGNRHEARKALGRVVEVGTGVLGDVHWAVLKARAYLDGNTGALGEPVGAVAPPAGEVRPPLQRRVPLDQRAEAEAAPRRQDAGGEAQPAPRETAGHEAARAYAGSEAEPLPRAYADALADLPTQLQPVIKPVQPQPPPAPPEPVRPERLEPRYQQAPAARPRLPEYQPPEPVPPTPAPVAGSSFPATVSAPAPYRRGPVIFAAVAAVLAAVIAVAALVFVLADRGGDAPQQPQQPVLGGGPAPSDITLRDFGTSVEIAWSDPGQGRTSFIIAGGHPGEVLRPMGEVGPGVTTFRLQGLNDQLDYCFAVFAVYSTTEFASSPQSCTSRPEARPSE